MEHSGPGIRAQKSAATKERIYQAGIELLRQYGYDGVTIEMITRTAGVSVGSFYHFFGSKENLLSQMSQRINSMFSLPDDLDYAQDDCRSRIHSFYRSFCDTMSGYSHEFMNNIFFGRQGNKTLLIESRTYRRLMKEMLQGFQQAGKIRQDMSIDQMEEILMIGFFGVLYHWATSGYAYPLYDKLTLVIDSILSGFIA